MIRIRHENAFINKTENLLKYGRKTKLIHTTPAFIDIEQRHEIYII